MKSEEFKKGIESLRQIRLGKAEKASILKNVLAVPQAAGYAPEKSHWWQFFANRRSLSQVWASVALVGALATFILYNAESAIPGDLLYSVKVSISEPLRGFLAMSPENKAEWESAKAIRRLDEAADLALKGKLDNKTRSDLENLFKMHVDSFNDSISQTASSTLQVNLIKTEFEANVSARVQVLETLDKGLDEAQKQNESPEPSKGEKGENATSTATSTEPIDSIKGVSPDASSTQESSGIKGDGGEQNAMQLRKFEDAVHKKLKERKKHIEPMQ